jgi:hypothetical protein
MVSTQLLGKLKKGDKLDTQYAWLHEKTYIRNLVETPEEKISR